MTPTRKDSLERSDLPALYKSASATARSGQLRYIRATGIRLVLLVVAALTAGFIGIDQMPRWVVLVSVACFATALAAEIFLFAMRPSETWREGRLAAESTKTLAWRFAVGGAPFPKTPEEVSEDDLENLFLTRLRALLANLRSLNVDDPSELDYQISPAMRELRSQPQEARKLAYLRGRLEDQEVWYRRKAKLNSQRAVTWMLVILTFEVLGLVGGGAILAGLIDFDVLGFLAAAAAAAAGWLQTKQHERRSSAYSTTAQEIARFRTILENLGSEEKQWAEFVDEAEGAISIEHTHWKASFGLISDLQLHGPD